MAWKVDCTEWIALNRDLLDAEVPAAAQGKPYTLNHEP